MKRRNIERELLTWQVDDGEYIHLAALRQALPGFRWDLYLVGETAASRPKVMRTKPLLGRLRQNATVVLMSSMREWLDHYNADRPEAVAGMLDDLRAAEREYMAKLRLIRAEVRAKSGEHIGRKPQPKQATKSTKPLKVTSGELFRVW